LAGNLIREETTEAGLFLAPYPTIAALPDKTDEHSDHTVDCGSY